MSICLYVCVYVCVFINFPYLFYIKLTQRYFAELMVMLFRWGLLPHEFFVSLLEGRGIRMGAYRAPIPVQILFPELRLHTLPIPIRIERGYSVYHYYHNAFDSLFQSVCNYVSSFALIYIYVYVYMCACLYVCTYLRYINLEVFC